jgi:hypothetical protein
MRSKIGHYSINLLIKYLDKLGRRVSVVVERKDAVA